MEQKDERRKHRSRRALEEFAIAYMEEPTVERMAKRLGISQRTADRTIASVEFRVVVGKMKERIITRYSDKLTAAYGDAIRLLQKAVLEESPQVRPPQVAAARAIIDHQQNEIRIAAQEAELEALREQVREITEMLTMRNAEQVQPSSIH